VIEQVRRRATIILTSVAIGGAASVVAAYALKPSYTATALLAVNDADTGGDPRASDVLVDTQIAMLQSNVFAQRALEAISHDDRLKASVQHLIDLQRRFKVVQQLRSRLIALNFSAKSASDAADIANKIARQYVEDPLLQSVASVDDASDIFSYQIGVLEGELQLIENREPGAQVSSSKASRSALASELRDRIAALKLDETLARRRKENREQTLALSPPVQLVALAQPPTHPSSLNPIYTIIAGTALSGNFGVALALLLGALDKRIYLPLELVNNFTFPYAGALPTQRRSVISMLLRGSTPSVGYLHAIDAVLTETLLMQRTQRRTILITTADSDNKTSEFALRFASAAARMRRRVLLVDIDSTERDHRRRREFPPGPSVFDVLSGQCPPCTGIQSIPTTGIDYMPSSFDSSTDGLALIANGRLNQLVADLRLTYDCIILRGPPVIGVSETKLIASAVDATILVVRSGRSTFPDVKNALERLSSSMALGASREDAASEIVTILTDAPRRSLPARYRDEWAPQSSTGPSQPRPSTSGLLRERAPEPSNRAAEGDIDVKCVVSP
jgi:Mrp family chromosome partitioning ATPase